MSSSLSGFKDGFELCTSQEQLKHRGAALAAGALVLLALLS